ncbi:MAG: hypothetical protein DSY42_06185 [Aquifex sp.]|nr:MAG: hypothetical protein DSY42_06185 [Aquifex sp.]
MISVIDAFVLKINSAELQYCPKCRTNVSEDKVFKFEVIVGSFLDIYWVEKHRTFVFSILKLDEWTYLKNYFPKEMDKGIGYRIEELRNSIFLLTPSSMPAVLQDKARRFSEELVETFDERKLFRLTEKDIELFKIYQVL